MDLEEVADELYAVPPEEFIALRTARQDDARAAGDRALVKSIGGLGKPSTAAWVCNLLVREKPAEVESLIELGQLLREAQERLSGEEMRALNAQRTRLISALTRQATGLARDGGHRVSTSIADQVEDTLRAALADPEAGEALRSGRLTSGLSYSGLGTARPGLRLVPTPKPEKHPEPAPRKPAERSAGESAAQRREREREERRRAAEDKRRRELAEARRAAEDARTAAAEARAAADEQRRDAEQQEVVHAELRARVDELADRLAEAERAEAEAAVSLKRAQRRAAAADREVAEAAAAAERAVGRVRALERD